MGCLCIYRPPNSTDEDNFKMSDVITSFLKFDFKHNLIMGDFNFSDIQWPFSASSRQSKLFLQLTQDNFLHQHVTSPTRKGSTNILDLVLTTPGTIISDLTINEELDNSDHYSIHFSLTLNIKKFKRRMTKRNIQKADWLLFQQLLISPNWHQIRATQDVNRIWNELISRINSALDAVAPLRTFTVRNFISSSQVRTALRHKRRFFRTSMKHQSLTNIVAYEKSVCLAKKAIMRDITQREKKVINSNNPKSFWSYVNRRLSVRNSIKCVVSEDKEFYEEKKYRIYLMNISHLSSLLSVISTCLTMVICQLSLHLILSRFLLMTLQKF